MSTTAILKTTNFMVMVYWQMMLENMKVDFKMGKKTDSASSLGLMDLFSKDFIKMIKSMDKENFTIEKGYWFDRGYGNKITSNLDFFCYNF